MKWHIVRGKKVFCEKTIWGGEQRGAWGNAPNSGLIFLLFLPYHWLDQAWWMTEGGEKGEGWTEPACKAVQACTMRGRQETAVCKLPKGGMGWRRGVERVDALGRSIRVPGGLCMGSVVRPSILKEGWGWRGVLLLKSNEYVWSSFQLVKGWSSPDSIWWLNNVHDMSYRGEEQQWTSGARLLSSVAIHLYCHVRQDNSRRSSLKGITDVLGGSRLRERERAAQIKAKMITII